MRGRILAWPFCCAMAIWTTDDLESVQDAIRAAVISGFAELSLAGQVARRFTLAELRALLEDIKSDLDDEDVADKPHFGLRMTKLVPPGCG